ncbi:MAG: hypothetical protein ABI895_27860 [Deltaproteobacteria bacterium]
MAGKIANWLIDFCQMTIGDTETTSRLHMAAHELVENVLKYGTTPELGLEFELERGDHESFVRIKTRNTAAPEQLEEVARRVSELRAAVDPIAYYDQLIRSTAGVMGMSGLGLARIRAEAGLDVDCSVEGREVSITVQATMRSGR